MLFDEHDREKARRTLAKKSRRNEETGCLEWVFAGGSGRYGTLWAAGKTWRAHRLVYVLAGNEPPPVVRHTCDNPSCIEITHLEGGTQKDNVDDMIRRGRFPDQSGENNTKAKLTWPEVREIKARLATGTETQVAIANSYGVKAATVADIYHGRHWVE